MEFMDINLWKEKIILIRASHFYKDFINPFISGVDYWRQNLMSKVTETIKIYTNCRRPIT